MPPPFLQPTPTKLANSRGDVAPLPPAKFIPSPPSEPHHRPPGPIRLGTGTLNDDANNIAERRRARLSMPPTKLLGRLDSICPDSKAILNDMAGMFTPKKDEPEALEVSPFEVEVKTPPAVFPVKKQSRKDRRDNQRGRGRIRKRAVDPGRIRRPARAPADLPSGEGSSKGSSKRQQQRFSAP